MKIVIMEQKFSAFGHVVSMEIWDCTFFII